MDLTRLRSLLSAVRDGAMDLDQAVQHLQELPYENLEFARVDHHRALRQGFPEVVYCQGKATEHILKIMQALWRTHPRIMATRAAPAVFEAVREVIPQAIYHPDARVIVAARGEPPPLIGSVAVLTGGTADLPVAEEAAITAGTLGCRVERVYDVGVAGLHRLLRERGRWSRADVAIVAAGMEGALPSVVGGMTAAPVIAVPTSVGYGAHFGGLAPLLSMLNSCAPGLAVVNIDDGFGAGYVAACICRVAARRTGGEGNQGHGTA